MNNIYKQYKEEILPALKKEFQITNDLAAPKIKKIVINVGASEALSTKDVLDKIKEQVAQISGQMPRVTAAKKSISTFKLKKGDIIGVMVTLRGKKAWDFMEKFVSIVAPRMRDFRGLEKGKFDHMGNYNLGITEQILFPQIDYSKVDKIRGMEITFVISNGSPGKSLKFFELLGLPFKN